MNDDEARKMLKMSLPVLYGSLTFNRNIDDNRKILKDFQRKNGPCYS